MSDPRSKPIPFSSHRTDTKRGLMTVWSFIVRKGQDPEGYLTGPEGTELMRRDGELPKLKVPKHERPGEFWILSAMDACQCAASRRYGLELVLPKKEAQSNV
jgi:hypothetical protein